MPGDAAVHAEEGSPRMDAAVHNDASASPPEGGPAKPDGSTGCADGFEDCEGAVEGCETEVLSNAQHCGQCSIRCAGNRHCVNGTCLR